VAACEQQRKKSKGRKAQRGAHVGAPEGNGDGHVIAGRSVTEGVAGEEADAVVFVHEHDARHGGERMVRDPDGRQLVDGELVGGAVAQRQHRAGSQSK
jgi:hypothetical protein